MKADAQRLCDLLNELEYKYGEDMALIADDPYCCWEFAGFGHRTPGNRKPRPLSAAFQVCVKSGDSGEWEVFEGDDE